MRGGEEGVGRESDGVGGGEEGVGRRGWGGRVMECKGGGMGE